MIEKEACGVSVEISVGPIVVALDGGSGAGKSTLIPVLVESLQAAGFTSAVIPVDDFFSARIPEAEWDRRSTPDSTKDVFEWERLRSEAIEPLLAGQAALWHPFDFMRGQNPDGTYEMSTEIIERAPADVILLDGAYTGGPQLEDLVDLSVLLDVPTQERHTRTGAREDPEFLAAWHARWDPVEEYYFTRIRAPETFSAIS